MSGLVLVVDDDSPLRQSLAAVLEDYGYRVEQAANGKEALEYLRAAPVTPSVILLDLMMPVMSGGELVVELRRNHQFATIPVVVMSAALGRRPANGIAEAIAKPFSTISLLRTVQAYCDVTSSRRFPAAEPNA
jgi:CheY-like chemotaxis protein